MVESGGQRVGERVLAVRVGWLTGLVAGMAARVVAEHWTGPDLDTLAAGVGPDGRPLPAKGWTALRRLGWTAHPPQGVYVSDRVCRCAEEGAARALRLAVHRRRIVQAIIATWPPGGRRADGDWRALRDLLPAGVSTAVIRNRTRQVDAHLDRHGGLLPGDLPDLEAAPPAARQVLLAATDRQLVTLARDGDRRVVVRVQLPLVEQPASRADWAWHVMTVALPPTVPVDAAICVPTLRVVGHRVRVDLPYRIPVVRAATSGHTLALGVDWGVNTLLTAALGRLTVQGRTVTDGRMLRYDATAVSAKLHRLRGQREHLAAKRDHHTVLAAGLAPADPRTGRLSALAERARAEHERVCARIRNLNKALAWSAARWAVDQAVALHATVVYVEDLSTLQARGTCRGNARLSGQVRGIVQDAIVHLAAKAGLAVVTVPARGTSRYCPRCGHGHTELRHVPAPDRPGERGWKWAVCLGCGLSTDRDHAAATRPARQTSTRGPKNRPTPKQPSGSKLARRVPDRRTVPAPSEGGQRPAGQEPKKRHHQLVTPSGPAHDLLNPRHHRTGFHHVHATPAICLPADFGPGTTRPRPTRNIRITRTNSGNQRRWSRGGG
ncbi:zinc ribbon domain-containing protein [Catellatospora sp. TT07R-123]|uniref:zinc ribbon domain-containing protein n=1 Tax=Catellatospora sp. TT07R-123 TaxID=2733863 RepID=UPI001BB399AA|nr:zinc ribbon domain-containing protein [Catellatospora sp. TT07R-123]